jgi:hypothetical protein
MDPTGVLPVGVELVHRWRFLLDNLPEWIGGGFSAGEFLLRSDGVLLRRSVRSEYSRGHTTWRAGPWSEFHRFPAGTGQGQARGWLIDRGYDLGDPSPVPVLEDVAGPYPGLPEHFQKGRGLR